MASARKEPEVELIDFRYPKAGTKLRLPWVKWPGSESDLVELIRAEFSKFGLLYQCTAKRVDGAADEEGVECPVYYAYVTFYAKSAAVRARLRLDNNLVVSGAPVRVRQSVTNLKNHPLLEQPLSRDKCQDLANYYFGFNGWSTEIVYSRVEETSSEGPLRVKYGTALRLAVQGFHVDGVGLSEETAAGGLGLSTKSQLMAYVRKTSLNAAERNAFSRIIMVVVSGSSGGSGRDKVTATLDTSVNEPFLYNPLWDTQEFFTVNEVHPTDENDFVVDDDFEDTIKDITC